MIEFIDTIISEPLKDIYQGLKNKAILWKKLRYDIKKYIEDLSTELDEFSIHRSNRLIRLSKVYIEPRLVDKIVSESYFYDYPDNNQNLNDLLKRNPRVVVRKHYVPEDNYKSIQQLLVEYNRIVILGQPGNGKTTILKKIVLDIAANKGVKAIPVYIPLRNSSLQNMSVFEFICKQFKNYGIDNAELVGSRLLEQGKLIILLDGIDEIVVDDRQRILEEINSITIEYPKNIFISTSRISSYNGELIKYKEVEICEFQSDDVIRYVNNWFSDDTKRLGLLVKIRTYPQIAEIANNPLLLSLICIVYDFDLEISSRRTTLYKRCIECLMRDWDAQRGFRRVGNFIKLDDLKRISILSHLAYNLHVNGKIYFDLETIDSYLSDIIERYGLCRQDIPLVIEEIVDHYGLILEVSKNVYSFSHLTFQEFFAATFLAENRIFQNVDFKFDFSPFWEEVFVLCASILPNSSDYLNILLRSKNESSEHIMLAGLCLSVDPVIDKELKKHILRLVLNLYHNYTSPQMRDRAQYVLVRIDDTFVGQQILKSMGVSKHYIDNKLRGAEATNENFDRFKFFSSTILPSQDNKK
ncbi:hypothetical protein GCM10011386_48200 [Parapedobacter defluvii]|uniref:NACHT domain-containing protein n=1 Tax=Parapedobacter defluvii TaxID=2045106 RepID=A0ABQ1N0P0_9SPHI|nr:NACHT domain-containing protein [Parapedobacter defluvii]GGC50364.1 hypothetical protein GCM10011386_48200 [Parapedobacter defluvii]